MSDLAAFSDTLAYPGQTKALTDSCYLIRHGDTYMLWDTGLPEAPLDKPMTETDMRASLTKTLVARLARIGVKPERIAIVCISHYHFDHTGQAARFPQATLMIGARDVAALRGEHADEALPLAHWLKEGGTLEPEAGDKDVFGDGSVVILATPGHTPGHQSLLLRLAKRGPILLTGDLYHFHEQVPTDGVPPFNTDRAETLASIDRFKKLAANLKATVIIRHDADDIAKLPVFPEDAE